MNVGLVTASVSNGGGGVAEAVRNMALNLSWDPQIRVSIYATEDRACLAGEGTASVEAQREFALKTFRSYGPTVFGYSPGLRRALVTANNDILHGHGFWTYSSAACYRWSRKVGRPYVISPHGALDPWVLRKSAWKKQLAAWAYDTRNLRGAACLHALNTSELESIRAFGVRNAVAVIPNGVAVPAVGEPDIGAPWSGKVEEGTKVVLFLGRLNPKKGIPNLLRAWQRVRSEPRSKGWHLVIVGPNEGDHERELQILAQNLAISECLTFIGPLYGAEKTAAFQSASAFVLPSFSEGLPIAVLEAWASGLPVLMTPECNLSEGYVSGAAIGITSDSTGIAAGLSELFAMSNVERRRMGARGRALVEERFSWPRIAQQMIRLYEWVLGGGPPPAFVSES